MEKADSIGIYSNEVCDLRFSAFDLSEFVMENPSWRLFFFHSIPLYNARWRKVYAVVFQSCRLYIVTAAIANATTFIIPLALP